MTGAENGGKPGPAPGLEAAPQTDRFATRRVSWWMPAGGWPEPLAEWAEYELGPGDVSRKMTGQLCEGDVANMVPPVVW